LAWSLTANSLWWQPGKPAASATSTGEACPFRFGKQRLLLAAFQTPEVEHEENWQRIVQLASVQMWLGRELAGAVLRPWERYLPRPESNVAWPGQVQRHWFATRTGEKRATRYR